MDIDKYLQPEYDFSRLMPEEFDWLDATREELIYVFNNQRTVWRPQEGYPVEYNRWFGIGFSNRSRCFEIVIEATDDLKYTFISFNQSNEHGIELLWCRQGRILSP